MAGKYFGIPFALSGDRTSIPDAAQPGGSVSFTQGFTLDYELENTDPNYKPVPREETNALYYDITEAIGIVQKQGFADWAIAAAPYPINAFVRHNDIAWRNTVAGNSAEPGTDATWANETIPATDYLNTQRIDIASASTVDLTGPYANTRHINITGTTTINSFTVTAGQCYFVRFAGGLTLTNSAGLVTNRGANITTSAGDTCIIRATAENTVEILCGNFLNDRGLGSGQTLQNVASIRSGGVTYTNTTGRSIIVYVDTSTVSNFSINGVKMFDSAGSGLCVVIPHGATYSLQSGAVLDSWWELR